MSRSTTGRDCLEAYATVPNSFAQLCRLPVVLCRTGYISSAFQIHGRSSSVRLRHGTALTARERTMAHAHFATPAVSLTLPRSSQAHVSRESCEEVSFVMSHVRPTHVLVELCKVQHC